MFLAAGMAQGAEAQADAPAAKSKPITVNVVVSNNLKHTVRGLQASDFTVLDNRRPVKLTGFRMLDPKGTPGDPLRVVIVLDAINVPPIVVAREREELNEFLKQDSGQLENPTSIALLTEDGIKAQQGATRDGKALLEALNKVHPGLRTEGRSAGFWGAADRFNMSLEQLRKLAAYEATVPGRKMILVVGPGWPLLPWSGEQSGLKARQWAFANVVQFTNGLREANITLYCLDPYELGRTDPFYYQEYLKPVKEMKNAEYANLSLQVLAEHSGGQVLINGHDVQGELNEALRDAGASYELTFEAAPGDRTNEYHALQVTVGKPGMTVRTVAGYYAHTMTPDAR